MSINVKKLNESLNHPQIKEWMVANFPDDYARVLESKNREAELLSLCNKISASSLSGSFITFISRSLPDLINADMPLTARLLVSAGMDINGIFSCYNPTILRYPMQLMFRSDKHVNLKRAVESITHNAKYHEHIIVGDTAYVEHTSLKNVPERFWEIKVWKAKNRVR
jgi:hypothetical protein